VEHARVGRADPDVIDKVAAVFEAYWNSGDFVPYDRDEFLSRASGNANPVTSIALSPIELRPEPFQERMLEQIALARECGHHRNLLVSATGTGKTVMAALDYARLRETLPRARLLFVAHREEILTQSLLTFRQGLRDHSFAELWVGGNRPRDFEHVFASIQSLSAAGLDSIDPTHFDVVIVDDGAQEKRCSTARVSVQADSGDWLSGLARSGAAPWRRLRLEAVLAPDLGEGSAPIRRVAGSRTLDRRDELRIAGEAHAEEVLVVERHDGSDRSPATCQHPGLAPLPTPVLGERVGRLADVHRPHGSISLPPIRTRLRTFTPMDMIFTSGRGFSSTS
jgi:hypothetical protein